MFRTYIAAASVLGLGACGNAVTNEPDVQELGAAPAIETSAEAPAPGRFAPMSASAEVVGTQGNTIGQATFTQGPTGVLIRVDVIPGSLAPGWHGLHLHEKGDCSDVGTFKLSGGHQGKHDGAHGLLNPDLGPEPGDLPNAWVAADGSAGYEAFSTLFELAPAVDADGLALLIHAGPDDQMSQPIGGAGDRVACGVVK